VAGRHNAVPNELVLAVPTADLYEAVGEWRGVRRDSPDIWRLLAKRSVFRPRPELEEDPTMKQLISYTIFTSDRRVFVMKRLGTQGESRLHGLLSIGVGGHMNPAKEVPWPGRRRISDLKALAILNTQREIREEVVFAGNPPMSIVGFLNDDRNSVGRVHLGLVTVVHLPAPILAVRETDKMLGAWVEISKLNLLGKFESWSSLVLEGIV